MKIWAHSLVKNEARWLWYSVTSVADYVDRILLWDTGSTDESIRIENALQKKYPDKVFLNTRIINTPEEFPLARQEMLDETDSDWFLVLDGDEVWWNDPIKRVVGEINKNGSSLESIVVPMVYPIGDIFHKQEEAAGHYKLAGKTGNISLRAVNRRIDGLSSSSPHGKWGWTDSTGKMIQDRDPDKIKFVNSPYMHFSLLPRSVNRKGDEEVMKRAQKLKHEIGDSFPKDYFYPEAFFRDCPEFIPSPWKVMDQRFKLRAAIETPLRKMKRRVLKEKVGY